MEGGNSSHSEVWGHCWGCLEHQAAGVGLSRGSPSHGDGRRTRGQAHLGKHISSVSVIAANISLAKASHVIEPKDRGREADAS